MSFRIVRGVGNNQDPAVILMAASGVIRPGGVVEFSRTGGVGVTPATSSSTTTNIFGVGAGYQQLGVTTDAQVEVIPFASGQLWEADCANAATTAQVGIRHSLSASQREVLHNTATDVSTSAGIFRALAMVGSTSGSGKLIGTFFGVGEFPIPVNATTFLT